MHGALQVRVASTITGVQFALLVPRPTAVILLARGRVTEDLVSHVDLCHQFSRLDKTVFLEMVSGGGTIRVNLHGELSIGALESVSRRA